MVTATHTHNHHEVDRTAAAVVALILMVATIAVVFPGAVTDEVEPQTHYLEIKSDDTPLGLSFETR